MAGAMEAHYIAATQCTSTVGFCNNSCGGIRLAPHDQMSREILCDHCERTLMSKAYRVISEDAAGVILLNMIVCHPCNQKAKELGLETREFNLDDRC